MARDILSTIRKCDIIFSNGEDVLVAGKTIWLFRGNGEFAQKLEAVRRPHVVAFLPNRTALVDSGVDRVYHYLDLKSGDILWSTKMRGRRSDEGFRFAVTPDGSTVYNLFYAYRGPTRFLHVERIIPAEHIHDIFPVKEPLNLTGDLAITGDLFCDGDGTLCALQYKNITRYEDYDYMDTPQVIFHYGILALPIQDGILRPYWKMDWKKERIGKGYSPSACDGRYILYENLSILDLKTQRTFFLLNDASRESLPISSFRYFYDPAHFLLTLWYTGPCQNVIIDCKNRTLVGRYFPENPFEAGYGGCLIGDKFWQGTAGGVAKKPFPCIEPPIEQPSPLKGWWTQNSEFYAKHPELW